MWTVVETCIDTFVPVVGERKIRVFCSRLCILHDFVSYSLSSGLE